MSLLTDIILLSDVELSKYINKISSAGATLKNREATKTILKFYKNKQWLQDIRLLVAPEMGLITRDDSTDVFVPTLVGVTDNNATQTTAASQPYLAGDIAPNKKYALHNPNGSTRFMQHTSISYAANEAWSVTFVLNWNGRSTVGQRLIGNSNNNSTLFMDLSGNNMYFRSETNVTSVISQNLFAGKTIILQLIANGSGNLSLYINGVGLNYSIATNFTFAQLLNSYAPSGINFYGKLHFYKIQNRALSASDVLDEYNMLRSIYPEIESVQIGSQTWATSNFEAVCTPMGNLIANVTDNTTWSNSTATYDSVYAATSGTVEQKTYAAVKAAAMWCHYNNDVANGAIYGKLYNWYAVKLLQMDIDYYNTANPSNLWGWRLPTQTDFNTLVTTLGGTSVAGGKMKVSGTKYWSSPNTGATNESGFSGIAGGRRRSDNGLFAAITTTCYFHSQTVFDSNNDYYSFLESTTQSFTIGTASKIFGFSLRLIKS